MDYQLKDKKAFVSGSTAGIGFSIAKLLANEGAAVVINGRSQDRVDQAIEAILAEQPDAKISGIAADFGQLKTINYLISQLGPVDILVNNVGVFKSQSFEDTDDTDWQRMFDINVMSGVRLSRAFLPAMLQNNWGRIIFISSECAMLVPEDLIAYSMTKLAILSVSRGLAQTTRGTGVTVNSVLPGSTMTEGADKFLKEQAKEEQISTQAVADNFFKNVRTTSLLERFTTPEEIAQTVVYLASPLSSATNGAAIKAEGGSIPGI